MNNNNDKNNNLTKYVLSVFQFCPNFNLFFVSVKEKKKKKKKKEKSLPSIKKIANKIIASFLIKFCHGNRDKM